MNTDYLPGSFGGDPDRIADEMKLECKICWYVYDPVIGDDYCAGATGHDRSGRCPTTGPARNVDGRKHDFMVLDEAS